MLSRNHPDRIRIAFDDTRLAANPPTLGCLSRAEQKCTTRSLWPAKMSAPVVQEECHRDRLAAGWGGE